MRSRRHRRGWQALLRKTEVVAEDFRVREAHGTRSGISHEHTRSHDLVVRYAVRPVPGLVSRSGGQEFLYSAAQFDVGDTDHSDFSVSNGNGALCLCNVRGLEGQEGSEKKRTSHVVRSPQRKFYYITRGWAVAGLMRAFYFCEREAVGGTRKNRSPSSDHVTCTTLLRN